MVTTYRDNNKGCRQGKKWAHRHWAYTLKVVWQAGKHNAASLNDQVRGKISKKYLAILLLLA
jgi:hypothetical protein